MNIAQVSISDIVALKQLAERSLYSDVDASDDELKHLLPHIQNDIETSIENKSCVFLKIENEELLGYVLIKDAWNLMHLFIEPGKTNMGLGRKLLTEAITQVKSRENRGYIVLNSSRNAVPFYKKMGFFIDLKREPKSESSTPMRLDF